MELGRRCRLLFVLFVVQIYLPVPLRGQAAPFHRDTTQVWNTSSGLPQDTVRQFLETRDGFLWMATDGGLVRFDGYDFTVYDRRNTPAMQSDLVNALFEDRSGSLWVATSNGLLKRTSTGPGDPSFTLYNSRQGLPSGSVLAVHEDASGRLCAETSAGRVCLAANGLVFSASPIDAQQTSDEATAVASPPAWTAAPTGLTRLDHGQATVVPMPAGFTGSEVLTIYTDREGNVWVGSENAGAAVLRQPSFTAIGKRDGLADDQIRSLLQDAHGDLWFGTAAGLTRLHGNKFSTTTVAQGLASNEILALAGPDADDLWVGTPDGLSHLQHGHAETLTASDGLPDDNIRSLLLASDRTLWIGTSHGLASLPPSGPIHTKPQTKSIHAYTQADGLGSNVVGALLEDADGSLWVGTLNGLSHLVHGRIRTYGLNKGVAPATITALGTDQTGRLWIGTSGGGLFTWKDGAILPAGTPTGTLNGRLPSTIYGIVGDAGGRLWLSTSTGVYRVAASDLRSLADARKTVDEIPIGHFDVADGLRLLDCASGGHPESILTYEGQLWLATLKGASVVDTHDPALDRPAPPVGLESIAVDDTPVSPGENGFRVAAGHDRLAFHYAGLHFAAPSKVRYRYRLEPFDRGWIDAGTRRTAYYTNIPPGRYTFRVLASTNGGDWSAAAAAVDFTIAPRYYQTWWFYTLIALVAALIAWQLYLYRLRQVELRFHAVLAERGRIAREIHDTLAQDIVGISVQLELVSRLMAISIDKAREQLAETRALVRRSLAGARSSIWDLRSPSSSSDLPARLRDTAKQLTRDSPAALDLRIGGTYRPFTQTTEDELLRIAQEAITNAVRHGSPRNIGVSLAYHATGVRLTITDDGRGFIVGDEKSGPSGHYGIRGMHERAERAHATLEIQSQPGAGTTVIAEAISA